MLRNSAAVEFVSVSIGSLNVKTTGDDGETPVAKLVGVEEIIVG